jgi:hypothetical protein
LKHSKDPTGQVHLEPIQARNQVIRKLMGKFDVIVESVVTQSDGEFRAKLISAITSYREGISLLTMHRNLSAEEKELFQEKIDVFYDIWIELFGEEGITNYIQILGSGHMLYFLEIYDCLYMYSQQGWEDLNNGCQAFLMQNSSRGATAAVRARENHTPSPLFDTFCVICFGKRVTRTHSLVIISNLV